MNQRERSKVYSFAVKKFVWPPLIGERKLIIINKKVSSRMLPWIIVQSNAIIFEYPNFSERITIAYNIKLSEHTCIKALYEKHFYLKNYLHEI